MLEMVTAMLHGYETDGYTYRTTYTEELDEVLCGLAEMVEREDGYTAYLFCGFEVIAYE